MVKQLTPGMCARLNTDQQGLSTYGRPLCVLRGTMVEIASVDVLPSQDELDDGVRYNALVLGVRGEHTGEHVTVGDVPPEALDYEPGLMSWSHELSIKASRQGWDLFDVDGEMVIQKLDDDTRFADDGDAWRYVWEGAELGDMVAKRALEYLFQRHPTSYAVIRDLIQKDRVVPSQKKKVPSPPRREMVRFEWMHEWNSGDEEVVAVYVDKPLDADSPDWHVVAVGRIEQASDLLLPQVALDSVQKSICGSVPRLECSLAEFYKACSIRNLYDVVGQSFALDNGKVDMILAVSQEISPVKASALIVNRVSRYTNSKVVEAAAASKPTVPLRDHMAAGTIVLRIDKT